MSEQAQIALCVAVTVALRQLDSLCERDREQVLLAAVEVMPEAKARAAQDALFALREARRLQMELVGLIQS